MASFTSAMVHLDPMMLLAVQPTVVACTMRHQLGWQLLLQLQAFHAVAPCAAAAAATSQITKPVTNTWCLV
jgi:hypothetical protein